MCQTTPATGKPSLKKNKALTGDLLPWLTLPFSAVAIALMARRKRV